MRLLNSKKGLSSSLLLMTVTLFVVCIAALVSLVIWTNYVNTINALDDDVVSAATKADIVAMATQLLLFDKIFVVIYIGLLLGFIISASTLPSTNLVSIITYVIFLGLLTALSMFLTNTIDAVLLQDLISNISGRVPLMLYLVKYLPYISLSTGIIGSVIFYSRYEGDGLGGGADDTGIQ